MEFEISLVLNVILFALLLVYRRKYIKQQLIATLYQHRAKEVEKLKPIHVQLSSDYYYSSYTSSEDEITYSTSPTVQRPMRPRTPPPKKNPSANLPPEVTRKLSPVIGHLDPGNNFE